MTALLWPTGPLLVALETRSAFLVAAAALLQRLPWLLFGLQAGVVADRVDRRLLLMGSETFRAVVIVILAGGLLLGHVSVWLVLLAMLLLGIADVFSNTSIGHPVADAPVVWRRLGVIAHGASLT